MKTLNCEYVLDIYPDVLHGRADASTAASVRAHISGCEDCRAETVLIDAVSRSRSEVPAGLAERASAGFAVTRPRFPARRLAVAATVAIGLIGGTLLLNSRGPGGELQQSAVVESGLGVVTVEAAMLSGTGSLQDLTVEELEQLLGEIES